MLTIDVEKNSEVAVVHCSGRLVRGVEVCTLRNAVVSECSRSTAQTVFAICISARMFSCMRAPPEDVHGHERDAALGGDVARPREDLADHAAHRAAHEGEIHGAEHARQAPDGRRAGDQRVTEAGCDLGLAQPLRVRAADR